MRRIIPPGPYNWRGASTQALVTSVWFPAAVLGSNRQEHVIGPPSAPLFRLGQWANDAQPAVGPFPLIVVSHGTGGSAGMMAWFASGLASRGYMVAAVNHPGNNGMEKGTAEGFLLWWERARDLTVAVDYLLRDQEFGPLIDPQRIGAAGFSLGGYTMIAIAGGLTDPSRLHEYCRSSAAEGCADPPEFPNLSKRWAELQANSQEFQRAVNQAGHSRRDPRIGAVFAIAPALGPVFIPESLRRIRTPIHIVSGSDDAIVPIGPNAQRIASLIPGAKLTLLPGVGHYTFLATCTDKGRHAEPQLCSDANGTDRAAIHQRTIAIAASFFQATLR